MGISKEKLCFNLEVETITNLYNSCGLYKPNSRDAKKKSNQFVLTKYNFCTALEIKGNSDDERNDKVKQTELISLTAMWASRSQSAVFPAKATYTPRKKLNR